MNREFKSKFSQMQDNQSGLNNNEESERLYAATGNVRNISFAWPDGKLRSFNYVFLVTHEYDPNENTIQLEFTTHAIVLKGFRLEQLYYELLDQRNRLITCTDVRYNETVEEDEAVINEILITEK